MWNISICQVGYLLLRLFSHRYECARCAPPTPPFNASGGDFSDFRVTAMRGKFANSPFYRKNVTAKGVRTPSFFGRNGGSSRGDPAWFIPTRPNGQARNIQRVPAEARGRSRNPTEAKTSIIHPRNRISHGNLALELWVTVPDPLKWADRKSAEAHGIPRKLKIA